jgi:hypothetical protein
VAYSPDGRRLATWALDQTVRVWDAINGQELLILQGHRGPIWDVAYSPDGRRLATLDADQIVRLWDAASGQEVAAIPWHARSLSGMGVLFSPDGRRLAVWGADQTVVRVWDARTGQELLDLKGHTDRISGVAYSPDGRRLASASDDKTVRLWDAATGQELLSLKGLTGGAALLFFSPDGQRLVSANDQEVRVWESSRVPAELWRRRALVSEVQRLFDELVVKEEVVAAVRKDAMLSAADREFALQVALTHPSAEDGRKLNDTHPSAEDGRKLNDTHPSAEDGRELNNAAWEIVKTRDAGKDAYALALRQAQAAVRMAPGDGFILNTLGVAQYRTRRYAEALATLLQSEKLNARESGTPPPADLAFLAMAQHQLGKKDEAKVTLGQLREVMKQPAWAKNAEAQGFLHEAEGLIGGEAADNKKR